MLVTLRTLPPGSEPPDIVPLLLYRNFVVNPWGAVLCCKVRVGHSSTLIAIHRWYVQNRSNANRAPGQESVHNGAKTRANVGVGHIAPEAPGL